MLYHTCSLSFDLSVERDERPAFIGDSPHVTSRISGFSEILSKHSCQRNHRLAFVCMICSVLNPLSFSSIKLVCLLIIRPQIRKMHDMTYCAIRLILLKTTPVPDMVNAPFKTVPGANDVLYKAVIIPPVTAAVSATEKHINIAVILSVTASEQQLKDANCDLETASIITNANANEMMTISVLSFN